MLNGLKIVRKKIYFAFKPKHKSLLAIKIWIFVVIIFLEQNSIIFSRYVYRYPRTILSQRVCVYPWATLYTYINMLCRIL